MLIYIYWDVFFRLFTLFWFAMLVFLACRPGSHMQIQTDPVWSLRTYFCGSTLAKLSVETVFSVQRSMVGILAIVRNPQRYPNIDMCIEKAKGLRCFIELGLCTRTSLRRPGTSWRNTWWTRLDSWERSNPRPSMVNIFAVVAFRVCILNLSTLDIF